MSKVPITLVLLPRSEWTMSLFFLGNEVILLPSIVMIYKLLWLACLFLCRFPMIFLIRTLSQNNSFSAFSLWMGKMHRIANTIFSYLQLLSLWSLRFHLFSQRSHVPCHVEVMITWQNWTKFSMLFCHKLSKDSPGLFVWKLWTAHVHCVVYHPMRSNLS